MGFPYWVVPIRGRVSALLAVCAVLCQHCQLVCQHYQLGMAVVSGVACLQRGLQFCWGQLQFGFYSVGSAAFRGVFSLSGECPHRVGFIILGPVRTGGWLHCGGTVQQGGAH